jgi:predicted DNA binding protein
MPRKHTVQEISEKLGVPNSTLQYRLTRAEAWLARQFVSDALSPEEQQIETVNTELEV